MGTRALVLKNGKKWVYTHWDGGPESLGKNLKFLKGKGLSNTQQKHSIHRSNDIDYDFEKNAFVINDSSTDSTRFSYESGKHDDFFSYIYNITRRGIYYSRGGAWTGSFPKTFTQKDLDKFNWKELS